MILHTYTIQHAYLSFFSYYTQHTLISPIPIRTHTANWLPLKPNHYYYCLIPEWTGTNSLPTSYLPMYPHQYTGIITTHTNHIPITIQKTCIINTRRMSCIFFRHCWGCTGVPKELQTVLLPSLTSPCNHQRSAIYSIYIIIILKYNIDIYYNIISVSYIYIQ